MLVVVVTVPGVAHCRLCHADGADVALVRVRVFRDDTSRDYSVCERCIAKITAEHGRRPQP